MTTELPFLEQYDGQTIDQLLELEGQFRLDSLIMTLEMAIGIKSIRAGDAVLSPHEMNVLAIRALEREVKSGGYWQFFAGSASEFTPIIVRALDDIGCELTSKATANAMRVFGLTEWMPAAEVAATVQDKDSDDFEHLNVAYFATEEDLHGRLFEYVKANRDSIRIP